MGALPPSYIVKKALLHTYLNKRILLQKIYIKYHIQIIENVEDTYFLLIHFRQPLSCGFVLGH